MAKTSQIHRMNKRRKVVEKYAARRAERKAIINNANSSIEEIDAAQAELRKQPRDASSTRVRNRCRITGRSRGYLRKFEMSRIKFRELAHQGEIPGVTKASW